MFLILSLVLAAAPGEGTKVQVVSVPEAEVSLDDKRLGVTPIAVVIPVGGKHTLLVTRDGWSKIKRVITKAKEGEVLKFELVDLELVALKAKVAKAQVGYDKANAQLESAQRRLQNAQEPTPSLEDQVTKAEEVMTKVSEVLESASEELRAAEKVRLTDQKLAAEAKRIRAGMIAAPTVGANAPDAGAPVLSVFCAYDVPGDKPGKLTEVSYCSAGTLQLAQLDCQLHSRLRSKSASPCRCTADRSLIGDRCAGP